MNPEQITNPEAEWSIVAAMISDPSLVGEVVGSQLEASDFILPEARVLYGTTVELFYADQAVEPLTVAERCKRPLAKIWNIDEREVGARVLARFAEREYGKGVIEHAGIVKRLSTARSLLTVANVAINSLAEGSLTPEEVAGTMSAEALSVTSGSVARTELYDWMETGTEYAKYLRRLRLAREKGIELAVYTGLEFIDQYTKGIAPGELLFLGGDAGTGKSILGWKSAEGFAGRQMKKEADKRIATLIVSMEMGVIPSATRLAQSITNVDGMRLREGDISQPEYQKILREWKARDGLPIYFNYASNFRLSQLRALIVEAIRRFKVGFVVLDHFRQIDTDKRLRDPNERDEEKVRFIKEAIAKDLNVAVMCLAHTIKVGRVTEGSGRPRLSDLRGSGTIANNADFVGLLHRPARNLDEDEMLAMGVSKTDAEIVWAKARHTEDGTSHLGVEPATMTVWAR